jgi:hypothetical protein
LETDSPIAAEIDQKISELNQRSEALRARTLDYVQVQTAIAENNFSQINQMASDTARQRETELLGRPQNPFQREGDLSNLSVADQQILRGITQETTRQMRQDLREGNTAVIMERQDFAGVSTPDQARAVMRINQGLQASGLPNDFAGNSPTSVESTQRMISEGKISPAVPNARDIPQEIQTLQGERTRLNEQLQAMQRAPVELPALDAAVRQIQDLDNHIAETGQRLYSQFGGTTTAPTLERSSDGTFRVTDRPIAPFNPASVQPAPGETTTLADGFRVRMVPLEGAGAGGARVMLPLNESSPFTQDANGLITRDTPLAVRESTQNTSMDGTRRTPLTADQQNELVRVNDSLQLLRGNQSGLSVSDIPMSEGLRNSLGIPASVQPAGPATPGFSLERALQQVTPAGELAQIRQDIDRVALMPAEARGAALSNMAIRTGAISAGEQHATRLIEQADNTVLNRTVELLDPVNIAIKGATSERFIAESSQLNLGRANVLGEKVDTLTDRALSTASTGRFGESMTALREANGLAAFQVGSNAEYMQHLEATQLNTALFIGTLPAEALGVVDLAIAGGRRLGSSVGRAALAETARSTLEQQAGRRLLTTTGGPQVATDMLADNAAAVLGRRTPILGTDGADTAGRLTLRPGQADFGGPLGERLAAGQSFPPSRLGGEPPAGSVLGVAPRVTPGPNGAAVNNRIFPTSPELELVGAGVDSTAPRSARVGVDIEPTNPRSPVTGDRPPEISAEGGAGTNEPRAQGLAGGNDASAGRPPSAGQSNGPEVTVSPGNQTTTPQAPAVAETRPTVPDAQNSGLASAPPDQTLPNDVARIFSTEPRGMIQSMMDSVLNLSTRNLRSATENLEMIGQGAFNRVFAIPNAQGEPTAVLRVPQMVFDNQNFRITAVVPQTTTINYPPEIAQAIAEGRVALPSQVASVVATPRGLQAVPESTTQVQLLNFVPMNNLGGLPITEQAAVLGNLTQPQVQQFMDLQVQLRAVGIRTELAPQNLGINTNTGNLVIFDTDDIPVASLSRLAAEGRPLRLTPDGLEALRSENFTNRLDGFLPSMRDSLLAVPSSPERIRALESLQTFESNLAEALNANPLVQQAQRELRERQQTQQFIQATLRDLGL